MTTYPTTRRAAKIITLPRDRQEFTAMLNTHPVLVGLALVLATVVILAALGIIAWLAAHDKGTEAIGGLLLGLLGLVLGRLRTIQHQTNGTTSKLLDAQLSKGVQGGQSTVDSSTVDNTNPVA